MKEIVSLRKPKEKHFLNDDGTFTVQMYDYDIHYLDEGVYKEIDNSLVENNRYYENISNSYKVRFDKENISSLIVKDNNYINLSLPNLFSKIKLKDNLLTYYDDINHIDYSYIISNNKLKEAITLHDNNSYLEYYRFLLNTNMKVTVQESGDVVFIKNGLIEFILPKPYLIDAENNMYDKLSCTLKQIDETTYEYSFHLNQEWMTQAKFPVIIDPTIMNGRNENVYDVWLNSQDPDKPYGTYFNNILGTDENGRTGRALLKFVLPELPQSCSIVNATGYLFSTTGYFQEKLKPAINIHEVLLDWDEETATWNNMNDKYNPIVSSYFYPNYSKEIIPTSPEITEYDLTKLVKKMVCGQGQLWDTHEI